MKHTLTPALMCVTFLFTVNISAQNDGDYRTINTGNWTTIAIWERFSGTVMDWEPAAIAPNSNDGVISIRADHTVTVNAAVTADEIVVETGGTLAIASFVLTLNDGPGDDLVVHGTLNQSGSTLGGAGSTARIASDGVFNVSGNAKTWNATVTNDGVINWSTNSTTTANALFTNNGTVNITGNATHSTGAVTNNGTITKTSIGTSQYNGGTFTNHGTINVQAGTLRHTANTAINHGTITFTAATYLLDGIFNHEPGASILGTGTLDVNNTVNLNADLELPAGMILDNSGTITGDGNLTLSSNFTFSGGTISGNGTFVVNADIAWTAGTLARALTIPNGRTMTISGSSKTFSAPLTNAGIINWTAAVITGTALLTNNGTINISSNTNHEGVGGVVNNGMIIKTSAGTTRYHQGPFTNNGTIDVQAGTFRHSSNTFENNSTITLTSATLLISNTYNHNTGATILGSGTLDNDGTFTLNVDLNLPGGIIVDNSGTITGPGDLTINNNLTLTGTISGTGALSVNGNTTWTAGTLARPFTVQNGRSMTLTGTVTLNSTLVNEGSTEYAGGTWTGNGSFTNHNLFIVSTTGSGSGGMDVSGGITNFGTMHYSTTATRDFNCPLTNSGTLHFLMAATWNQRNVYTHNSGAAFSGTGTFRKEAGTILMNADLVIPVDLTLSSTLAGTYTADGPGDLIVHGQLITNANSLIKGTGILSIFGSVDWLGDKIQRAITVHPGAVLNITGSFPKTFDVGLTNNGTMNWSGTGALTGDALCTNNSIFNISNNETFGGTGTLINNGTIIKTGTGFSRFNRVSENHGTLLVNEGTFSTGGTFHNMGSITCSAATLRIAGTFNHNAGSMILGSNLLNVEGTLNLNIDLDLPSGFTLTNSGTITGLGDLTVNNNFTLSGTISGTGSLAVNGDISWTGGTLARPLTIQPGRTMTISDATKNLNTTLTNQGTCTWSGGGVTQSSMQTGSFINEGLWVATISSTSAFIVNGGFFNTSTGTLRKTSGGSGNGLQGTWTNAGAIEILAGTWRQTGPYIHQPGATITGPGTFNNRTSMTLNGDLVVPVNLNLMQDGAEITGPGNLTVFGTISNGIGSTITGTGMFTIHGTFTWSAGTVSRNIDIQPGGVLNWNDGNTKTFDNPVTNNGTINWNNFTIQGNAQLTNNGTVNITSNHAHQGAGGFINNGTISKTSTSTTFYSTAFTNSPTGVIKGVGNYSFSNLTNNGTIEPGLSPGVLTMNNNPPFSANSTLIIEMNGGGAPGDTVGHDQLRRTSTGLILDGTLTIVETAPVPDGDYVIVDLTAGTITGSFAQTNLPPFQMLNVTSTQVILTKENPTISCPDNVTLNNETGLCSAVVIDIDPTVSPGGTDFMHAFSGATSGNGDGTASGQAFNVGTTTVTYIVTLAQNVACSLDVTVMDVDLPTINCPENISVNNDVGFCTAIVNYSVPFNDNCPDAMILQTQGLASGSAFPVGTTTNTFLVTDAHGNTNNCSFTVTVTDNEAPSVTCPENISVSNDAGLCSRVVNYSVPFSDNCSGAMISQTLGLASGSAFPLGTTTNTFLVTDVHGNTNTCCFTVTVTDNEAPSVTCPDNISVNNDAGLCGVVVNYSVPFSDNCPGAIISQTLGLASGSTFPVGTTTNTFLVTDAHGNTTTCSFTVTVADNEAPSVTCPVDLTVDMDPGECTAVVNYAVLFDDNCPGAMIAQINGLPSGEAFSRGAPANVFLVTDASGNTASCSFFVSVIDNEAPSVTCPDDITVSTDPGACSAVVNYSVPFEDNCPDAFISQTQGIAAGSAFPIGTTTNVFLVTDVEGNSTTCSFTVTVIDNEAPSVTCPDNITLNTSPGMCTSTAFGYHVPYADNCDPLMMEQIEGLPSESEFPVGTTTNVFLVTDAQGNTTTCSFSVTVFDIEVPSVTCPDDLTVSTDPGECSAVINYAVNFDDNCPGAMIEQTQGLASGSAFPVGFTENVFLVTDASGNMRTCNFIVLVVEIEAPSVSCPDDLTVSTDPEECSAVVHFSVPFDDNCPNPTIEQTEGLASGSTFPVGITNNVFLVTDIHGNTNSCSFTVTITDNEVPTIECPDNITVQQGDFVQYVIHAFFDNCPDAILTQTEGLPSGSVFPPGVTINTFEAEDASGNINSCSFTVTVLEGDDPFISCPANVITGMDAGECTRVVHGIGPVAIFPAETDFTYMLEGATSGSGDGSASGLVFNPGVTTVTYTLTDDPEVSCSFTVTVNDIEAPSVTCPANISVNNDAELCSAVVLYSVTFSDNCPDATIDQTMGLASGNAFPVGTTTNVFVVTDASGNTTSCSFTVTVADNEAPSVTCPENISVNNDVGLCSAVVNYSVPFSDNCPDATFDQTMGLASGNAFPVGTTTNVFFVTDASGNTTSCSFTVTVADIEAPSVTCPENISVSNDPGLCSAIVNYTVPFSDNCPGAVITQTEGLASGSAFPVGTTTNTFLVTDAHGNTTPCSFTVTVTDNEVPSVTCPENISINNDAGLCSAVVVFDVLFDDNCPAEILTQTTGLPSGDVFPVGITTNMFVVIDGTGNTAGCSFTVTVEDAEAPSINCPENITVQQGETVNYSVTFDDNCPGAMLAQTTGLPSGSVFPVGLTTNTFEVEDASGNINSCSFTVTVLDGDDPFISCPANVITGMDAGECTRLVNGIDPTAIFPAEAEFTFVLEGATSGSGDGSASGLVFNPGVTTITYTLTDDPEVSCSFTVTVNDNEAPSVTCPENISINNDAGLCSAVFNYSVLFDDNCPGAMILQTQGLASGSAFPVGTTTNVFVVNDAAGNTAECSFTVIVDDAEAPSIHCPENITVQQGEIVNYSITFDDNCPDAMLTQTTGLPSGSVFPVGVTTNTFEAEDATGNINTCSFTVTVLPGQTIVINIDELTTVHESVGTALIRVTLSAPSEQTVRVSFATRDGTARHPFDYRRTNGVLSFNPGQTSKNISVRIIKDNIPEPDEFFTIRLSNPQGGILGNAIGTVIITESVMGLGAIQKNGTPDAAVHEAALDENDARAFDNSFPVEDTRPLVPNPQTQHAVLQVLGLEAIAFDVLLMDIHGRIVADLNNYANDWLMSDLAEGIYVYRITWRSDDGSVRSDTGKVVIVE